MSTELIINASLPETRIALMESGEIQELLIERASGKGIVGNIYKGRVTRVLPGMQAAFVDIGLEKAAFLYVDDVFVHSQMWEEDEISGDASAPPRDGESPAGGDNASGETSNRPAPVSIRPVIRIPMPAVEAGAVSASEQGEVSLPPVEVDEDDLPESDDPRGSHETDLRDLPHELGEHLDEDDVEGDPADEGEEEESESDDDLSDEDEEDDEHDLKGLAHPPHDEDEDGGDDHGPVGMGREPGDGDDHSSGGGDQPPETLTPPPLDAIGTAPEGGENDGGADGAARRRFRRGRRGGRNRRRDGQPGAEGQAGQPAAVAGPSSERKPAAPVRASQIRPVGSIPAEETPPPFEEESTGQLPGSFNEHLSHDGSDEEGSDRFEMSNELDPSAAGANETQSERPGHTTEGRNAPVTAGGGAAGADGKRPEFKEPRARDRRIKSKQAARPPRGQAKIEDLLKEGQEVIVQVAKDPIATKGARLTCHISLPGRHLVCMPTIDHVGVSRRIERDDERRKLRDYVERNRPKNLGFIVRTASGKSMSEKRIKQDIDYLTRLWGEIKEKVNTVTAPAMVYEDLNSVLRAIRDWVTEDIDKIMVDSRYHYNEIQRFVSHFMPSLRQKVELYGGDVPIFDAYNISTELSRSLERKVWLKSGGYLVVDQAEALVAIDVNTGRYVGKKNLEDTILKTNLEAVQEIAYQLRLRNCGGIIILDLIDMEKEENKHRVYRALEEALKKDRARPNILKISELGLVEMTRKRTRDTIIRTLCESCTHCEGKGFIKSKQTVAYEVMREIEREGIERDVSKVLVQAHADVIDILAIDERESMDQLERRYRKQIYLQVVSDFHPEQFEVIGEKVGENGRKVERVTSRGPSRDSRDGGDSKSGGRDRGRGGRDRGRGGRDRGGRDGGREGGREGGRDRETITPVSAGDLPRNGDGPEEMAGPAIPTMPTPRLPRPVAASANAPKNVTANVAANVTSSESSYPTEGAEGEADPSGADYAPRARGEGQAGGDDFYDEEDRLAFLRAQATQDAALANLQAAGGTPATTTRNSGRGATAVGAGGAPGAGRAGQAPGAGEGGRGGGRNRRGGRGKFRGGRDRGPAAGGPQAAGGAPSGGIRPVEPKPASSEGAAPSSAPSAPSHSGESGGGTGGES